jgi:hypothetical protein
MVQPNHMVIDVAKLMNDEKLMKLLRPEGHTQLPKGNTVACGSLILSHFIP